MAYDLFNPRPDTLIEQAGSMTANLLADISKIKGLMYIPEFLTQKEHDLTWAAIYEQPWLGDLKRRVQHYGWKYDYKARAIDYSMFLGNLPEWAEVIAHRLLDEGLMPYLPDQLIINEYAPGQGISAHVDCEPCFGDTIVSISLHSPVVMDFSHLKNGEKCPVLLEPRSAVILSGESRYEWTHGIAARKTDNFHGQKTEREIRISLTYRRVII